MISDVNVMSKKGSKGNMRGKSPCRASRAVTEKSGYLCLFKLFKPSPEYLEDCFTAHTSSALSAMTASAY